MSSNYSTIDIAQTNEWLAHLHGVNRNEEMINTRRNNVGCYLVYLSHDGRSTDAFGISTDDIQYLWRTLPVKEEVRLTYLRSLSCMVCHQPTSTSSAGQGYSTTGESRDHIFIDDEIFRAAYAVSDPLQRLVLRLGAYMGLRRTEMRTISDGTSTAAR